MCGKCGHSGVNIGEVEQETVKHVVILQNDRQWSSSNDKHWGRGYCVYQGVLRMGTKHLFSSQIFESNIRKLPFSLQKYHLTLCSLCREGCLVIIGRYHSGLANQHWTNPTQEVSRADNLEQGLWKGPVKVPVSKKKKKSSCTQHPANLPQTPCSGDTPKDTQKTNSRKIEVNVRGYECKGRAPVVQAVIDSPHTWEVTCLWEKASSLMTGENTEEEAFRGLLYIWIIFTVAHWAIRTINPFFNITACCTLRLVTEVINQNWLCAKVNMSYDNGKGVSGNKPLFLLL